MSLALGFKGGVLGIGEEQSYGEHGKFTVGATNNKIDFTIGAGALVATVASGTYFAGSSSSVASSLCAAIKAALLAADATGIYTATFDIETKKFTLARSAGTFTLPWVTGTNTAISIKALIGFTADDTGALSYTADSAVAVVQKYIEINSDGLDLEEPPIYSGAIPGVHRPYDERVQGRINPGGSIDFEMRYEGFELLLKHAMGGASTAEVASFTVVVDTNDMIDFKEDAGAELHATLTPGTYIMGESSADAASLCLLLKTQLEAAGVGTYAVTFSNVTKKLTIAVSGGASAVQFLWKTGVSGSDNADESAVLLLGFTAGADGVNGASDTSDTALVTIFDHTLTHADELPTGLTLDTDRDIKAFVMKGGKIRSLSLTQDVAGFLNGSFDSVGKDIDKAPVDTATLPTAPLVVFNHGVIQYDNSDINLTALDLAITNPLKEDRDYIGSRTKAEPKRNGKYTVMGNLSTEYESETLLDNFRSALTKALSVVYTHPTAIKTGFYYSITISIAKLMLDKALPLISDEGAVMYNISFTMLATDSSTREMTIVIRNTNSDIATNNY